MAIYPLPEGTTLYETRAASGYRFRIQRPIGQGGFGITYLAEDQEFRGPCVIKEFALGELCARSDATGSLTVAPGREPDFDRWLERFESEARQIHRIRHANVVRVRAVWRERGTAYYAMDLITGAGELPSPDEERWESMPWPEAEKIARSLLSALGAVHRQGLIHGDVKPSNILRDADGEPVLIDFGTVRTHDELRRTITSAMYTPGYAPPELTSRKETRRAGPWSDLYSWAMVVWGLVAQHPGIDGRPMDAASRQLIAESGGADRYMVGSNTLREAGVPDIWVGVLMASLELDPSRRPSSTEAVLELLNGAVPVRKRLHSATQLRTVAELGRQEPLRSPVPEPALVPGPVARPASVAPLDSRVEVRTFAAPPAAAPPPARRRYMAPALTAVAAISLAVMAVAVMRDCQTGADTSPMAAGTIDPTTTAVPLPPDMVRIESGSFQMGSPASEVGRDSDEELHGVTLTRAFWLSRTEVTQAEYQALMGSNPSRFGECGGSCPVEQVSWLDAVLYANERSRREGLAPCYTNAGELSGSGTIYECPGYRLPTEAEWEFAARAGTAVLAYGDLADIAWLPTNSSGETHRVGQKRANAWGLHDMIGNVWEWTHDGNEVFSSASVVDPAGSPTSSFRVYRGCGWKWDARGVRETDRRGGVPSYRLSSIGFRLARTAP
jgi:formylglycine-generating enzyme required for sulfatase activity